MSGRQNPFAFDAVRWLVVGVTGAFLVLVGVRLLDGAFERGPYPGLRSLAAVLLPVVVLGFVFLFRRRTPEPLPGPPPGVGFALFGAIGVATLLVLDHLHTRTGVPLTELVVSTDLALLTFSSVRLEQRASLARYCGFLSGVLAYIVLLGFPKL